MRSQPCGASSSMYIDRTCVALFRLFPGLGDLFLLCVLFCTGGVGRGAGVFLLRKIGGRLRAQNVLRDVMCVGLGRLSRIRLSLDVGQPVSSKLGALTLPCRFVLVACA